MDEGVLPHESSKGSSFTDQPFVVRKAGPGKRGDARIDGCGIHTIDGLTEFDGAIDALAKLVRFFFDFPWVARSYYE